MWPLAYHQMDAFGLSGFIVIKKQLRLFRENEVPSLWYPNFVPAAVLTTCSTGIPYTRLL
jgi:hypothetical protein